MNDTPANNQLLYLLGSPGTADGSFVQIAATSDALPRYNFKYHAFFRGKKAGGDVDTVVQVAAASDAEDYDWHTLTTLNDANPTYFFHGLLPYVRVVRAGSSSPDGSKVRITVSSGNTRIDG